MRLGTRSARLLATISPLALSLALAGTATARTIIEPEIDVAQIIASVTTQGNSANIINSSLAATNSAVAAAVSAATGSLDSINNVADSNTAIAFEANTIFAIARGTDGLNQIGTLDTGAAGLIDGAAIFNGGLTDTVDLHAQVTDSTLEANVFGSGAANLDTDFGDNLILAEGTFNRATSTIEVTVPPAGDLADPLFSAGYIEPASNLGGGFTGTLVTAATLNVVNVQVNRDFQSTLGDTEDTALSSGNEINFLRRENTDDVNPLSGNYGVNDNAIAAQANGSVSDNSIFVREEIETGAGTETGSLLFEGNGAIANYQLSEDTVGDGITALNEDSSIDSRYVFGGVLGATTWSGENLSLEMNENAVESSARLNASRNEITVDGAMQLSGQFTWDSLGVAGHDQIVDFDESAPGTASELFAAADFYIVNRQFAVSSGVTQIVNAMTDNADITLRLEDMDAEGSVDMNGNAISADVSGNSNQNIIGNATPDAAEGTAPVVDTVLASVNSQYVEDIGAESAVIDSIIRLDIGYTSRPAGTQGFGGFEGSSLTMANNSITSRAAGNTGTSSVGLEGNTIDNSYDSDDGATQTVDNSGAFLSADLVNDSYQASAGTTVFNNQRSFGDLGGNVSALLGGEDAGNTIRVYINAHPLDDTNPEDLNTGAHDSDSLGGSSFDVSGNAMEAAATGNGFASLIDHDAATGYTGSAGTLSQQALEETNIAAEAVENTIDVDLAVGEALAGPISDVSVSVDSNQIVARGTGNEAGTVTLVEANTFTGGAWAGFNDGSGLEDTAAGAIQDGPDLNDSVDAWSTVNASLGALTDQVLNASAVFSLSDDNDILVDVVNEPNNDLVLDIAGSSSVGGNTLGSQSRGNDAANLVALDVATTASSALGTGTDIDALPEYGPLAGIVARQITTGDGAAVDAITTGNNIEVNTGGLLTGSLDASGNRVIANAIGNLIANEVSVSALTLDVGPTTAAIVSSYIDDTGGEDDLSVDSSVFILNSQRNEGIDPETESGAPITATLNGDSSVAVSTDNLTSSTVSVDDNLLQATAAANSADNRLNIDIGSGPIFADILNRQGNSGDVTASNDGSSVTLDVNDANAVGSDTASANSDMTVSLDNNSIGSAAFGSSALNAISANASSNFTSTPGVESSATSSPSASNDSNGAMEAHGNMVVLNSQRTYGFDGTPVNITASTTNAQIALNVPGGMDGGSTSSDNNRITATATANDATNVITSASGSGSGLPSATINNAQQVSFANVSATVTSATISTTVGGVGTGANLGGSTSVMGGTISASATGNSAVNRISSQGQSFTRSGSF